MDNLCHGRYVKCYTFELVAVSLFLSLHSYKILHYNRYVHTIKNIIHLYIILLMEPINYKEFFLNFTSNVHIRNQSWYLYSYHVQKLHVKMRSQALTTKIFSRVKWFRSCCVTIQNCSCVFDVIYFTFGRMQIGGFEILKLLFLH